MNKFAKRFSALKDSQPESGVPAITAELVSEDENVIKVSLRGVVGDSWEGNDHKTLAELIEASPEKELHIHINSAGGSVFDGFGIANAILAHEGKTKAIIEGLAFSAASFIAIACDEVVMHKASTYGVHRSLTLTYGNVKEHEASAEWLRTIDEILVDMYVEKTGKTEEEIVAIIDGTNDGTIYTAEKAIEEGFADSLYQPKKKDKEEPPKNKGRQAINRKIANTLMNLRHQKRYGDRASTA